MFSLLKIPVPTHPHLSNFLFRQVDHPHPSFETPKAWCVQYGLTFGVLLFLLRSLPPLQNIIMLVCFPSNWSPSASWATMVVSFLIFGFFVGVYYPNEARLWDYTVSIVVFHIIATCLGNAHTITHTCARAHTHTTTCAPSLSIVVALELYKQSCRLFHVMSSFIYQ